MAWQRFRTWLGGLAPRERLMLTVAGFLLPLLMVWGLLWHPIRQDLRDLRVQRDALDDELVWMQQTVARLAPGGAVGSPRAGMERSLLAIVDQTARDGGLGQALKRVRPEGLTRVQVSLEGAAFDKLVPWLARLGDEFGVRAVEAGLDREGGQGTVQARLTLERR
ncbi:MAG: type II secretion system protein M [Magnetococcus sp. WYHC-3]